MESDLQALNALLSGEEAPPAFAMPPTPQPRASLGGRQSFGDRPPPPRASRSSGGYDPRTSTSGEFGRSSAWQRNSGMGNLM